MSFLRILGAAFLFLIIRQFLKLIIGVNQKQMPGKNSGNYADNKNRESTAQAQDDNIIEASFTRKE